MSKPIANNLGNPTDAAVALRLGELELTRVRMAWMLETQQQTINSLNEALVSKDVLLAARDLQIAKLLEAANEPELPMDGPVAITHANGHGSKH